MWLSVESLIKRLDAMPLILQLPYGDDKTQFSGVIDILTMEKIEFNGNHGELITRENLNSSNSSSKEQNYLHCIPNVNCSKSILEQAKFAREKLLATLADLDDDFAIDYLESPEILNSNEGNNYIIFLINFRNFKNKESYKKGNLSE